jgi:hypothetical protein
VSLNIDFFEAIQIANSIMDDFTGWDWEMGPSNYFDDPMYLQGVKNKIRDYASHFGNDAPAIESALRDMFDDLELQLSAKNYSGVAGGIAQIGTQLIHALVYNEEINADLLYQIRKL